jgi:hypothetical protein
MLALPARILHGGLPNDNDVTLMSLPKAGVSIAAGAK